MHNCKLFQSETGLLLDSREFIYGQYGIETVSGEKNCMIDYKN